MRFRKNKREFQNGRNHPVICPYKGRIVTKESVSVLGFFIPHRKTLCIIDENGVVTSNDGYGWIDKKGQIHRGQKSDYSTDYHNNIVGIIKNKELYLKNIRVGKWVRG